MMNTGFQVARGGETVGPQRLTATRRNFVRPGQRVCGIAEPAAGPAESCLGSGAEVSSADPLSGR